MRSWSWTTPRSDGSVDAVRSQWPGVRVIALDRNIGFAAANNKGIRETASELVLLLNSDTIVPRAGDRRARLRFARAPACGRRRPENRRRQRRPELSFGRMIGPFAELRQKMLVRFASPSRLTVMTPEIVRSIGSQPRACSCARRDAERGRPARRAILHVLRRCGFLRRHPRQRRQGLFHAGRRNRPPSRPFLARQPVQTAEHYRRSQLAFYQKHHPGWAPLLKMYLALRGKLPAETADKEG